MSDWQVGDLALCIESGTETRAGQIYTVVYVEAPGESTGKFINDGPFSVLWFAEFENDPANLAEGSGAERFRKIRPDEREACEPEFVTLLKRSRKTVRA